MSRFLIWETLITVLFQGWGGHWQQSRKELFGFWSCPGFVLSVYLFFIFNGELLSCMLTSIRKSRKPSSSKIGSIQVCVLRSCTRENSRGREMKTEGGGVGGCPWRVDGPAGPCVMCQFASVPLLCGWCWNSGKALVYWIRSHVNSSCQHVITPLDKERGFLLTHIWFLVTATHSPAPFAIRLYVSD